MNTKILVEIVHWIFIASGYGISIATILVGSPDVKIAGFAALALNASQTIHKVADSLQAKATVDTAVQAAVTVKTL